MPTTITNIVCERIYQIPARVICMCVLVVQMAILDYYLVANFNNRIWWLWIIPDSIVLVIFVMAFIASFKFLRSPLRCQGKVPIGGELPLGYIAWGTYSVFLATKVAIIFVHFAFELKENDFFGPNTLKINLALASVVFLLLVMSHHDAEEKSERHFYIDVMIGGVTMDVLDTVAFLEVLFIEESRVVLPFSIHYAIVAVAVLNLILPTIPLLILSRTQFGRGIMPRLLYTIHITVYMFVINVPLLVIRLLLWHVHSENISVFLMKNVLALGIAIKKIHASAMKIPQDSVDGTEARPGKEEERGLGERERKPEEIELEVKYGADNTPTTEL